MKYIYQNLNNSRLYTWQGQVLKVENFQSCCSFIALSGIKLKLATSQWPGGGAELTIHLYYFIYPLLKEIKGYCWGKWAK